MKSAVLSCVLGSVTSRDVTSVDHVRLITGIVQSVLGRIFAVEVDVAIATRKLCQAAANDVNVANLSVLREVVLEISIRDCVMQVVNEELGSAGLAA